MNFDANELEVINNTEAQRFEIHLGDDLAVLEYMNFGSNIAYTHTEVPPAYEGKGVGARLAHAALEYAKEQGLKVNPVCPYVKSYLRRHPEYESIIWGN
ncbi:MAG: N-acetyltransferase [Anaerolineae bacterium]|nr:N-acetyltransferase [Anaerolineae bacterium]